MKRIASALFFLSFLAAFGQQTTPPPITWQHSYGGVGMDVLYAIHTIPGGGYLLGGESSSPPSGTKSSAHHGLSDFWIIRVDAEGNKLWDKSFGGTGNDILTSIVAGGDGGFLLGGHSNSGSNGNKTAPARGGIDFWVVRIDHNGEKLWDRTYGGTENDYLFTMIPISDGGFLLGGYSASGANINKTSSNFGQGDFWIVRIDAAGEKLWDRSFGGSGDEWLYSLQETSDGGFILGGSSSSPPSGNKAAPHHGGSDFWIVRIESNGTRLWDRSYGGSEDDADEHLVVRQTSDGGYIIAGDSLSDISGNKTSPNIGDSDIWVIRLGQEANLLWQRTFGGTSYEFLTSLQETGDGGFILAGGSESRAGGTKTAPLYGIEIDFYLVRIDSAGNMVWDASYGGAAADGFRHVIAQPTSDGGFIVGGDSNSGASEIKTSPGLGSRHFWVLKLGGTAPPPQLIVPSQTTASIQQHGFRFFIEPRQNQKSYVAEYSTDLVTWTPFQTNLASGGQIEVIDPGAATSPRRFYRAYRLP
jgi:hypothetical protein